MITAFETKNIKTIIRILTYKVIIYSSVWRLKIEKHVSRTNSSGKSVSKRYHNMIILLYYLHCCTRVLSRLNDRYSQAIWFQLDFLKLRDEHCRRLALRLLCKQSSRINFYFYIVEYVGLYIILYAWEYCARCSGGVAAWKAFYTSWRKTRVRLVHTTRLLVAFEYKKLDTQFKLTVHVGTTGFLQDSLGAVVARQLKSETRFYFIIIIYQAHNTICRTTTVC